jgi:hypothetical protein
MVIWLLCFGSMAYHGGSTCWRKLEKERMNEVGVLTSSTRAYPKWPDFFPVGLVS